MVDPVRTDNSERSTEAVKRKVNVIEDLRFERPEHPPAERPSKVTRMNFGKDKSKLRRNLPHWSRTVGLRPTEQQLLLQILDRSQPEKPWAFHHDRGPTELARYFGIKRAAFFEAVASLKESGYLVVTRHRKLESTYRVPETVVNEILARGNRTLKQSRS